MWRWLISHQTSKTSVITSSLGRTLTGKKSILFRLFTERWYTGFVPSYFRPVIFKKVKRHRRILGAHRINSIVDENSSWCFVMPNKCKSCLVNWPTRQHWPHTCKSPCSYSCGETALTIGKLLKDPTKLAFIPPPPKEALHERCTRILRKWRISRIQS